MQYLVGPDKDFLISVTWIGINDVHRHRDTQEQLTALFQLQDKLFNVGARKFVFLTVPPFDRAPLGILFNSKVTSETEEDLPSRIANWNTQLQAFALGLDRRYHGSVSVSVYDVAALFTKVLDNPIGYGFKDATSMCEHQCIWYDDLHPTCNLHKIVAQRFGDFLKAN